MKDNFSQRSADYSKYRPHYPTALFDFITAHVFPKKLAWDAGTGNGQTAAELASYFDQVYATDISRSQLNNATLKKNITYALEPSEKTSLEDASVNLVTVSQALHWFSFEKFYGEVRRVAAKGAVFAAWTYTLLQVEPDVDYLLRCFHFETLEGYWDEERKYVNDGYASIPFPFKEISTPVFHIEASWTVHDLAGYLDTWSAVQKYSAIEGRSPVASLIQEIKKHWEPNEIKLVHFPLHLKMGLVH